MKQEFKYPLSEDFIVANSKKFSLEDVLDIARHQKISRKCLDNLPFPAEKWDWIDVFKGLQTEEQQKGKSVSYQIPTINYSEEEDPVAAYDHVLNEAKKWYLKDYQPSDGFISTSVDFNLKVKGVIEDIEYHSELIGVFGEEKLPYNKWQQKQKTEWGELYIGSSPMSDKELKKETARVKEKIDKALSDPDVCKAAVKEFTLTIGYVKEQTPELCAIAVSHDAQALDLIREQTPELCLEAVKQNKYALIFIKNQTPDICAAAIENDIEVVEFIKDKKNIKSESVQEAILKKVQKDGRLLRYVPEEMQTQEICLAAVKQNGLALAHVGAKYNTDTICLAAVKQNGEALEYVSRQTPIICIEAVKRSSKAFDFVKERTPEICLSMVNTPIKKEVRAFLKKIVEKTEMPAADRMQKNSIGQKLT